MLGDSLVCYGILRIKQFRQDNEERKEEIKINKDLTGGGSPRVVRAKPV